MTTTLATVHDTVNDLWPEATAEEWDRVGLVSGDRGAAISHIHLAVDATLETVTEAVDLGAQLLLTHHPLLLRGVHSIAESTAKGRMLATLIRANCALIAAHTNADQPEDGVSAALSEAFGLRDATPIVPGAHDHSGIGRVGTLAQAMRLEDFAAHVASVLPETAGGVRVAGDRDATIRTVALCGGAGDSLLQHPRVRGADVYVTSDLRHHPASEARDEAILGSGPALIDIAHWAAESLWLPLAAAALTERLPGIRVTISERNTDPWTFRIDPVSSGSMSR